MNEIYPFRQFTMSIPSEWIDFNDHMNAKYYGLVAYDAHIRFIEHLGLDESYKNSSNSSTVVIESHISYEKELCVNDEIEVISWLVSIDEKRMRSCHELYCINKGYRVAVSEQLDIHVDLNSRKASPFPKTVYSRLSLALQKYKKLKPPKKTAKVLAS